jgi:hypothetical protein
MADAVAEYGRHRDAPDEWALGRFVVPMAHWKELDALVRARGERWPVSLLAGCGDAQPIRELVAGGSSLRVEGVECKAETIDDGDRVAEIVRSGVDVFVEPSAAVDFPLLAKRLKSSGAAAKIRTGGVTATAFPSSDSVLAFLKACRQAGIRFKATAGLHHAVRGEYRLTYEPSPPTGVMFGFLNISVAAALVWFGADDPVVFAALEETSHEAFEFSDAGITWRDHQLTLAQLDEVRSEFFVGFGSCSFQEPMSEIGLEAVPRS